MIFEIDWNGFEALIKAMTNSPALEGADSFQSPLLYHENQESISLYIPTPKGTYKTTLTEKDFGEGKRFTNVEAMKLELFRIMGTIQLTKPPQNINISVEQS